jgi:4-amino-4-deoxychorismate lyase
MSLLLETIRILDGKALNLPFHTARYERSMLDLFRIKNPMPLSEVMACPQYLKDGVVKCRITYSSRIQSVTYEAYVPRQIKSLRMVFNDDILYDYKFADRKIFSELLDGVKEDDILIIRNGLVTDTSYANILFFDGERWYTPASPLLKGTKREWLIHSGVVREKDIRPEDIPSFKEARIINAMIDPLDNPAIHPVDIV